MTFSVAELFQVSLLLVNAMAILSERRFLAKFGLATTKFQASDSSSLDSGGGGFLGGQAFGENFGGFSAPGASSTSAGTPGPMQTQMASLLGSVRMLMRWPLIFLNSITIVFALIFG
jgi:hypothetical protein